MALRLQKAVGKIVSVLRTDIPDHEFFYVIHDEPQDDTKKTTKEARIPNTEENTDGTIREEPTSFGTSDSGSKEPINTTTPCDQSKSSGDPSSDICLVMAKGGKNKRSPNVKLTKRKHKNNYKYITKNQQALFIGTSTEGVVGH